jgi:site-specific DNA-methyltransferase (adenine-specific)
MSTDFKCSKCNKQFLNKSTFLKHQNLKSPCKIINEATIDTTTETKTEETTEVKNEETTDETSKSIQIKNMDGLQFLESIKDNSIDLILTDPPYIISKDTGMDKHYNKVKDNEKNKVEFVKTENEWLEYKKTLDKPKDQLDKDKGPGWSKENYLKYGTILGKKYCSKTQYGEWDNNFSIDDLEKFVIEYYKKLRKGGTLIIWFDIWKITTLKDILEKHKFKQIRLIEWIKTNPLPINSKINYLTNCREIAILAVKDSSPTFNSEYDKGIYDFPMASGKNKFHPTQKSLPLFEALIEKHSNPGDIVLDTFLGGGTTAIACKNKKRHFKGCEINNEYVEKVLEILK